MDADDANLRGWPGSYVTNAYTDLQQLFNPSITSPPFTNRLQNPGRRGATPQSGKSSYDRYTFYRLAAQLGTDSTPALEGKLHLNFKNPIGEITNNVIPWTNAVEFFTKVLKVKPIPIPARLSHPITAVVAEKDYVIVIAPRVLKDPKDPAKTYSIAWFDMWRFVDGKADEHWDGAMKGDIF